MKKLFLSILLFALCCSLIFATDIRSLGLGGAHVADNSDYYTLFRNPAGLGVAENHLLLPSTTINVGGPLEQIYNIFDKAIFNDADDDAINALTNDLIDVVTKNNGLDTTLKMDGPLTFGFISNGFGFGLTSSVIADASVKSITFADVNAQLDTSLTLGFGHQIKLPFGGLALGISATGTATTPKINLKSSLTDIMNGLSTDPNILKDSFGFNNVYAYTISGGAQFELFNLLTVGATWNNILSGTYSFKNDSLIDFCKFDLSGPKTEGKYPQTVAVGASVKIPTFFTLGLINSWTVYLDHENILEFFPQDTITRNPILGFGAGTEIVAFNFLSLRAGLKESYLNAGVGIKLGMFNIEYAIYGKELGLEPGSHPQLNMAFAVSFKK